ncbi:hypothetical protein WICPIJ_000795 [Wickerhamomyces pijperi]|uniref:Uncharacterized protein n=1 Tax=Wickerhamomyces pijperi TaxID=599730 RepID=A0A9P8QFU3_WICPI|nr:hypothetical protein WICPIJ_000795 [Wickerhamomyces pijperi]
MNLKNWCLYKYKIKSWTLGGSLNVLEDNFLVVGQVDNGSKVVVQTFVGLVVFKQLDQDLGTDQIRVLGGDLDDDLQVLSNVLVHQLLQTSHGLLHVQLAKVGNQPVSRHSVSVDDDSLDVLDV